MSGWQQIGRRLIPLAVVLLLWLGHVVVERSFGDFKFGAEGELSPAEAAHLRFQESSQARGLLYPYESLKQEMALKRGVMTAQHFMPFSTPVAVGDLDGDGFEDILVANEGGEQLLVAFRNRGDGNFSPFPVSSGLSVTGPGIIGAIVIVDFDNDGRRDVAYTFANFESQIELRLLRNLGGGVFADARELIPDRRLYSVVTGMRVIDFDRDGFPDLYVTALFRNVVALNFKSGNAETGFFRPVASRRDEGFAGPNYLFRNVGGKKFERVAHAGGAANNQLAWDAVIYDVNGDGYQDIIVANDLSYIRIYENNRSGGFNQTTSYRIPFQYTTANMGVNVADLNGDGRFDFFVTNAVLSTFTSNTNHALIERDGPVYHDQFHELNLGRCGWSWGSQVADLDLDGFDEVVVANGYFKDGASTREYAFHFMTYSSLPPFLLASSKVLPRTQGYRFVTDERNCLFKKRSAAGPFLDVATSAGLGDLADGRGVALIDPKNDGRYSLLISNHGSPLLFYQNVSPRQHAWVGFRLRGQESGLDAFGATVTLRAGDALQRKYYAPSQGFSSQSSAQLLFGLGQLAAPSVDVEVSWPSGKRTTHPGLRVNAYHLLREGGP